MPQSFTSIDTWKSVRAIVVATALPLSLHTSCTTGGTKAQLAKDEVASQQGPDLSKTPQVFQALVADIPQLQAYQKEIYKKVGGFTVEMTTSLPQETGAETHREARVIRLNEAVFSDRTAVGFSVSAYIHELQHMSRANDAEEQARMQEWIPAFILPKGQRITLKEVHRLERRGAACPFLLSKNPAAVAEEGPFAIGLHAQILDFMLLKDEMASICLQWSSRNWKTTSGKQPLQSFHKSASTSQAHVFKFFEKETPAAEAIYGPGGPYYNYVADYIAMTRGYVDELTEQVPTPTKDREEYERLVYMKKRSNNMTCINEQSHPFFKAKNAYKNRFAAFRKACKKEAGSLQVLHELEENFMKKQGDTYAFRYVDADLNGSVYFDTKEATIALALFKKRNIGTADVYALAPTTSNLAKDYVTSLRTCLHAGTRLVGGAVHIYTRGEAAAQAHFVKA